MVIPSININVGPQHGRSLKFWPAISLSLKSRNNRFNSISRYNNGTLYIDPNKFCFNLNIKKVTFNTIQSIT